MHDALAELTKAVQGDPEVRAVLAQCLDLGAAHGITQLERVGRDVVVLGCEREIRSVYRSCGRPQAVEGLRARHLVDEVQVDVEQLGLVRPERDGVPRPDLLDHVTRPDNPCGSGHSARSPTR